MKLSGVQVKSAIFMNVSSGVWSSRGKTTYEVGDEMQISIPAKPAQPVKTYEITHALRN